MIYIDMYIFTDNIQFSIFRNFSNTKKIVKKDEIVFPVCYSSAQKLNYVRNLTCIFIEEYSIKYFKVNIGNLDKNQEVDILLNEMKDAIKMEGVLEELFISRGVKPWK
ncbi:hypothetical protein [Intestinibacter bartlettii]|uniref:Uncharacterized protein n=1 Tax=Intestinibacter bartlettii TaxID=261299 RepID=A0ABS6E256_9FIRM|nr:hypothetical protein [Intestinibacter bartlettii]MBU5337547.1 hypothetical protein [Intestinibacter bartlettii]MDO5010512.1 hypothetical protein [Intestinibacter bartlettii]